MYYIVQYILQLGESADKEDHAAQHLQDNARHRGLRRRARRGGLSLAANQSTLCKLFSYSSR